MSRFTIIREADGRLYHHYPDGRLVMVQHADGSGAMWPEREIAQAKADYVAGCIEIDEFEDRVWVALGNGGGEDIAVGLVEVGPGVPINSRAVDHILKGVWTDADSLPPLPS